MSRQSIALVALGCASLTSAALAQTGVAGAELLRGVTAAPVTDAMLRDPDPADWLMYSRTYDAQRYSPLDEIDRDNVGSLQRAWSKPLPAGQLEIIPLVHRGVMYLTTPGSRDGGSRVVALNAATGETLWEYVPPNAASSRIKALGIYGDMIYYTAPAPSGEPNPVIALDAATGAVRWQTPVTVETHTAGAIVVEGKVISGRACNTARSNCYIAAHDARTGKEAWRFYTSPDTGEPGDESWGGKAVDERRAAAWGLPGTYDPVRRLVYWGIANPMPNTRGDRHGGNVDAIPRHAPADLYSNSTVALNPDTGELVWHYQHLPGDDWDMDINEEKTLIRTVIDPDPRHVKWINPNVRERRGARRRDHGRRRRRRVAERPRHRRVPLGDAVPIRHGALHSRRYRRRDRRRAHQLQGAARRARHDEARVLLERAQLLADGVFAENELAVRPVHRPLLEHDARRSRR